MFKGKNKKVLIKICQIAIGQAKFYLIAAHQFFLINDIKSIDCTFPISLN